MPANQRRLGYQPGNGTTGSGAAEWHLQVRRDDRALGDVAAEWDDLYRRCATATPFSSGPWLASWWRGYGRPGRLVVALVRRHGVLVAAAAMTADGPRLRPAGVGISDFTDVLLDDSCAEQAARHLAAALLGPARRRVIDLPDVPPTAAVWRLVDVWPNRTWRVPGSVVLELRAEPLDRLVRKLPRDTAKVRRRKQRRIEAAGITVRLTPASDAAWAVRALLRLHHQQWRGRGINPEHARARFADHLARAVPAMAERSEAQLVEYRSGGDLVAVDLLVIGRGLVGAYLYGLRPDLRRGVDVTQLLLGTNLELARRLGRPTLSLLRGDEPHKRRWRPRESPNQRVILAGSSPLIGVMVAASVRLRRRAARMAAARLPWLVPALRRYMTCRPFFTSANRPRAA
jgi:hypothetical protein